LLIVAVCLWMGHLFDAYWCAGLRVQRLTGLIYWNCRRTNHMDSNLAMIW
jgi:hypothetical protein